MRVNETKQDSIAHDITNAIQKYKIIPNIYNETPVVQYAFFNVVSRNYFISGPVSPELLELDED